jgi:hypothetical protein
MSPPRKLMPVRANRVIAHIAHDRWPRFLNATMNKTAHIEIIAETSIQLRGFSLANMPESVYRTFGYPGRLRVHAERSGKLIERGGLVMHLNAEPAVVCHDELRL